MIETWEKQPSLPDTWHLHPSDDPRFEGLLDLSNAICDAFEFATEGSGDDLIPTPLELAAMLRSQAERLEFYTDSRRVGGQD
jgi:hypothetical protein